MRVAFFLFYFRNNLSFDIRNVSPGDFCFIVAITHFSLATKGFFSSFAIFNLKDITDDFSIYSINLIHILLIDQLIEFNPENNTYSINS